MKISHSDKLKLSFVVLAFALEAGNSAFIFKKGRNEQAEATRALPHAQNTTHPTIHQPR